MIWIIRCCCKCHKPLAAVHLDGKLQLRFPPIFCMPCFNKAVKK